MWWRAMTASRSRWANMFGASTDLFLAQIRNSITGNKEEDTSLKSKGRSAGNSDCRAIFQRSYSRLTDNGGYRFNSDS
jgi:hypothetical protein